MKRIIIAVSVAAIVTFISYQFIFDDRRSKLKIASSGPVFDESVYQTAAFSPLTTDRYLVKNGRLLFEVRDAGAASDSIERLAKLFEGYVSSATRTTDDGKVRYSQTVRVSTNMIDDFARRIERMAIHIESKIISASDVTEEYVDLQARLITKRKIEARLQQIVSMAKTVEDVLKVETQLGTVRGEITAFAAFVSIFLYWRRRRKAVQPVATVQS